MSASISALALLSSAASAVQGNGGVEETSQTLWQFLSSGGPVMIGIGLFSIVAVACAMERYLRLRRGAIYPARLDAAIELVKDDNHREAREIAEQTRSPAGRILLAGVRRRGFTVDEVERAMHDQAGKELEHMRGRIRAVSLVGNLSPLLGLLGTVIGIADAFHRVVKTGMGKPEHLAAGIEMALTTTIAGLCVAIPALVVAAHLHSRVRRLMLYTDEKLSVVVEFLAARRREETHAA